MRVAMSLREGRRFQRRIPMKIAACGAAALAVAALAGTVRGAVAADQPELGEIAGAPYPAQLQATVQGLVGFGTRHTLSDTVSAKRGIGAARRWVQSRFEKIGHDCRGCLSIETPSQTVSGSRLPKPAEIVDGVAIRMGTS